jgi:hypothetical protein
VGAAAAKKSLIFIPASGRYQMSAKNIQEITKRQLNSMA